MPPVTQWEDFETPDDCLAFLKQKFPSGEVEIPAFEMLEDGSMATRRCRAPKYLFRGESRRYPDTLPAWERLHWEERLDEEDRKEIRDLTTQVVNYIASRDSNFELNAVDAEGLVQHLGLPTRYVDFTSCLEVAVAFAIGSSQSSGDRKGAICVLDVEKAIRTDCGQIAEFHHHPWCKRAKRQKAFGFAPIGFGDLKSPEAAKAGVQWCSFSVCGNHLSAFRKVYAQLLEQESDPVAGLLRFQVNNYVADTGKLRPAVAQWLVDRIAMAPLVAEAYTYYEGDLPDEVNFLPPKDHLSWKEETEKEWSLCYWSKMYQDSIPKGYLGKELRARSEKPFFFPRTYHANPPK